MRPGFTGTMKRSPITGRMERYYPAYKRKIKYAISAVITMFLLGCACLVMIISMNLQGYISRKDKELWGDEHHPLYFPLFAQLAEEGEGTCLQLLFDHLCFSFSFNRRRNLAAVRQVVYLTQNQHGRASCQ